MDTRRMCPNCRAFITTDDKVCPYCDVPVGPKAVESRSPADVLGGLIPHARFTTIVLLLINTGFYVATSLDGGGRLLDVGAKGPGIAAGEWWRLITAGFLHGGLLHILMNSWVLFDLGTHTEESYGTARYVVLYVVTTITGFYASFMFHPYTGSVGSSAGIFGLLGAMIALGVRDRSIYGSALRRMYTQWAIYGLVMGFLFPYTDNAAHIGGLIGGFALGYVAGTPRYRQGIEQGWKLAAGAAILLTLAAFRLMFRELMRGGLQ